MEHVRFIHAADLHLDSPFKGIGEVSPGLRDTLQGSTFEAFRRIVDRAIQAKADFVVFAGDLYDGRDRSLRALVEFRRQMERLAEHRIPAFVVHGNHDPLNGWGSEFRLPENVITFDGSVESHPVLRNGDEVARVTGVSYTRERVTDNLASAFRREPGALYAVALLHANIGGQAGHADYAPAALDDLLRSGFDYWALGHVHTRAILSTSPAIVYPGNPQGRHVRETGPRGCYQVDVDTHGRARLEFVSTDVIRWDLLEVSIRSLSSFDQLLDRLMAEAKQRSMSSSGVMVVRCTITGNGPLHRDLQRDAMAEELKEQIEKIVPIESVRIVTGPEIDFGAARLSRTVLADFIGIAERALGDPAFRETLAADLAPLFRRRGFIPPDDARLREWVQGAANLGIDLLTDHEN